MAPLRFTLCLGALWVISCATSHSEAPATPCVLLDAKERETLRSVLTAASTDPAFEPVSDFFAEFGERFDYAQLPTASVYAWEGQDWAWQATAPSLQFQLPGQSVFVADIQEWSPGFTAANQVRISSAGWELKGTNEVGVASVVFASGVTVGAITTHLRGQRAVEVRQVAGAALTIETKADDPFWGDTEFTLTIQGTAGEFAEKVTGSPPHYTFTYAGRRLEVAPGSACAALPDDLVTAFPNLHQLLHVSELEHIGHTAFVLKPLE